MSDKKLRFMFMLGTGLIMGTLFAFQSKSLSQANLSYSRESRVSIFKEIQIVKESNQSLSEQTMELEKDLAASDDREQALENLRREIEKYEVITGKKAAIGKGVTVEIDGEIEALWFTDLVNELFSAGAEAVSINGIRLTPNNLGFDTIPNGQILFGGEILSPPFVFEAIGDSETIAGSLEQSGGIISRIKANKPDHSVLLIKETGLSLPAIKSEE
jgi:uncharacterized protein YlxW (UPF0749 family)